MLVADSNSTISKEFLFLFGYQNMEFFILFRFIFMCLKRYVCDIQYSLFYFMILSFFNSIIFILLLFLLLLLLFVGVLGLRPMRMRKKDKVRNPMNACPSTRGLQSSSILTALH